MSAATDYAACQVVVTKMLDAMRDARERITCGDWASLAYEARQLEALSRLLSAAAWRVHEWDCEERGVATGERP